MARRGAEWAEVRTRFQDLKSTVAESASGSSSGSGLSARLNAVVSCLDLTSLGGGETSADLETLCEAAVGTARGTVPGTETGPACAAVCVYPQHAGEIAQLLRSASASVSVVAVGPAFPTGQGAILEKLDGVVSSVRSGADEIDVVLDWRAFLSGERSRLLADLRAMREAIAPARLKVILETGALPTPDAVAEAASLALDAGAAFIKTSTGKFEPGAEFEPSLVMLETLREHVVRTGRPAGFKVAGGVRTVEDALLYAAMTEEVLGIERITPDRFRIGASSLLDALVAAGGRGGGA